MIAPISDQRQGRFFPRVGVLIPVLAASAPKIELSGRDHAGPLTRATRQDEDPIFKNIINL